MWRDVNIRLISNYRFDRRADGLSEKKSGPLATGLAVRCWRHLRVFEVFAGIVLLLIWRERRAVERGETRGDDDAGYEEEETPAQAEPVAVLQAETVEVL